jgi:hypothetical protein
MTLFARVTNSIRQDGIAATLTRVARYPFNRLRNRWYYRMLGNRPAAEIFTAVYEKRFWNDKESVSGSGSTLIATEGLRQSLPTLLQEFAIRSVFDAPCGDFNWMQHVVRESNVRYRGADIVPHLIEKNIEKYQADDTGFSVADICVNSFPQADLWLCRDCLPHLSYQDILRALTNFCGSGIPLMLTTTASDRSGIVNFDIPTGSFREINLFAEPFLLSPNTLFRIADPSADGELCLWSRDQITQALPELQRKLKAAALLS